MFKKLLIRIFAPILIVGLLFGTSPILEQEFHIDLFNTQTVHADATNKYWVGGTGNWSDAANHWADSSGGAPGAGNLPTSATNVWFDANSFSGAGQTVTVNTTANCKDMDWTGATNTPTLQWASGIRLNVSGSCTFIADMIIPTSGADIYLQLVGTGSLTTAGINVPVVVVVSTAGSVSLVDNLSQVGGAFPQFVIETGTFITNNNSMTNTTFVINGAGVKTLTLGASTINCAVWLNQGSNITLTANTATINCSGNFTGGSLNYNGASIYLTGATSTITGSNTFNTLSLVPTTTQTITFTAGTTQTAATFNLSGDATHQHTLTSSNPGLAWMITKTGGGYVNGDYLTLNRSVASPNTYTFYAGTHSVDNGNNPGWIFTAPTTPTVTTQLPTPIHAEYATGNGTITDLGAGNANSTSIGFDWGIAPGVYTASVTTAGSYPLGAFTDTVSPLVPFTTYYYRAKAQNGVGWGYGAEQTFTSIVIHPPLNFTVSPNGVLTWVLDEDATETVIVRGTSNTPTTLTDGVVIYNGAATTYTDVNPSPETQTYYYSAWGVSGIYYSQAYSTTANGGGMISFIGVIALGGLLTWFSWKRRNIALSLAASLTWLALAFWILIGDSAPFSITDSWGLIIGGVLVIMAFIPVLTFMDNPVVRSSGGKSWTEYKSDKELRSYDEKQPSIYDRHRAEIRAKLRRRR
jgi:hypothetical protein